jgi:hypothetical protein
MEPLALGRMECHTTRLSRCPAGSVPTFSNTFKRRASVAGNVLAPQKTRSSQAAVATSPPLQQQQQESQWGWGPLKLQWPYSSTVDADVQPQLPGVRAPAASLGFLCAWPSHLLLTSPPSKRLHRCRSLPWLYSKQQRRQQP